jgi:hypothetical protein
MIGSPLLFRFGKIPEDAGATNMPSPSLEAGRALMTEYKRKI